MYKSQPCPSLYTRGRDTAICCPPFEGQLLSPEDLSPRSTHPEAAPSLQVLSTLSLMGQILGKPNMGDKAKKPVEAPAFPDYMLDPDAVVSLPASMASLLWSNIEALTDRPLRKGQGQGGVAKWQPSRLYRDQTDVG